MLRLSLALLAAAVPLLAAATPRATAAPASATGPQAQTCPSPRQGRYAVMGMGTRNGAPMATPTAHLLEERWLADGKLQGTLVERFGRSERASTYSGQLRVKPSCVVEVERQLPWGMGRSEVVVDGRGRPLYSINRSPGSVITSRWLPMAPGSCQASDLNGLVLSSQEGLSWIRGGWSPNAVVQREQWSNGSVEGIALSSTNGIGETAGYSGQLQLDPNGCWGNLQERDVRGQTYTYRALIVNGRRGARGYFYLQRDPDDLTVGWLVRD